jgi:hypothetical protein
VAIVTYRYTDEEQQDTKRFQQRFEAHITESREYRRAAYTRQSMDYSYYQPGTAMYEMEHRIEPFVAIHLPKDQFDRLMDQQSRTDRLLEELDYGKKIIIQLRKDERVRDDNPAVAKAYRNYLTLLELART